MKILTKTGTIALLVILAISSIALRSWAACNPPDQQTEPTLSVTGPCFAEVASSVTYTLDGVGTLGGTYQWEYTGFDLAGDDDTSSSIQLTTADSASSAVNDKTVTCTFTPTDTGWTGDCSAELKMTVVQVDAGKLDGSSYIPVSLIVDSGGNVDIDLQATPGTGYPAGSNWQRSRDGGTWEDGPPLTETTWQFSSGGEWMIRASIGIEAPTLYLVDDLKISSKIDHVLRGFNTTMGDIELYGNNLIIPDEMKEYLTFKFKAPQLSQNTYESITLSGGQAAITFEIDEVLESSAVLGSTVDIAAELSGDLLEKAETFTGVVVDSVNNLSKLDFRPTDSATITFSISPNVASVLSDAAQMITDGLKVVDTLGNASFGEISLSGSSPSYTASDEGTPLTDQGAVKVDVNSDFYTAYEDFRAYEEKFTIWTAKIKTLNIQDALAPFTMYYAGDSVEVEIELTPTDQSIQVNVEDDFLTKLSYDADTGILCLKANASTVSALGESQVEIGVSAVKNDGSFSSDEVTGNLDIQKKLSKTLLDLSTDDIAFLIQGDLKTDVRVDIDTAGYGKLNATQLGTIKADAAATLLDGSLTVTLGAEIKAEGAAAIEFAYGSPTSDLSLGLGVNANFSYQSSPRFTISGSLVAATLDHFECRALVKKESSASCSVYAIGNPVIGNGSLQVFLGITGNYSYESESGTRYDSGEVQGEAGVIYAW